MRRFIIGIGSLGYGDQEVPQSAICQVKNQKSSWHNSVQDQKPKNQELRCPRAREDGCPSSRREREFALLSSFCSIQAIHGLEDIPADTNTCEGHLSTQSTESNAHLCRNTLTDTPRNKVLPALWASLSPVKLAHEINHHR